MLRTRLLHEYIQLLISLFYQFMQSSFGKRHLVRLQCHLQTSYFVLLQFFVQGVECPTLTSKHFSNIAVKGPLPGPVRISQSITYFYGNFVNSITLKAIGIPDVTCHRNKPIPAAFAPMCTERAVSFPFCIAGTMDAARAQRTTRPAPA